jgi:hypothetical protein
MPQSFQADHTKQTPAKKQVCHIDMDAVQSFWLKYWAAADNAAPIFLFWIPKVSGNLVFQ